MKKLLVVAIVGSVVFVGLDAYTLLRSNQAQQTEVLSVVTKDVDESKTDTGQLDNVASDPVVFVEKSQFELFAPGDKEKVPGTGSMIDYDILYVTLDGEKRSVFPEEKYLRVVEYAFSPSQRYLYVLNGQVIQDASVTAYIYDLETATLEVVHELDRDPAGYNGFASQDLVHITWTPENRLHIAFDNPFLAPGVPESGPAIGLQIFESVASDTPWIVEQVN